PFIEQIMVIGADRKFVSALIVPAFANIRKKLSDAGVTLSPQDKDLIEEDAVKDLIREQLDKYNIHFGNWEQVRKFTLLPQEWTVDNGALTPKLSIRRKVIEQQYQKEIRELYGE